MKAKYNGLQVSIYCLFLLLFLFWTGILQAAEQNESANRQLPGIKTVIDKVKEAVQTKNFNVLKPYVSNEKFLYWAACGPGDVEPEKISFGNMVQLLSKISRGADIHVREEPDVHLWDFEKPAFYIVNIYTEGWTGEYPFLSFGFKFRTADSRWTFQGVCDSTAPEHTQRDGKYVPTYFKAPQFPRPGPRIFKDCSALSARIEEIVLFKAFDALEPYATKKTLVFGQCTPEIMDKDKIEGKETPVEKVIDFLKKNTSATDEIKTSGIIHKTYYETTGWSGEYPVVAFWFSETKKGWEWAGISYCKTKHAGRMFPNEPTFK